MLKITIDDVNASPSHIIDTNAIKIGSAPS
jgi:hypothetical protein